MHCKGVQLSQLHQQSYWHYYLVGALLALASGKAERRQVHPQGYFTSSFFTLPLAVRTMLMPRWRCCMRTPPRLYIST